jgi:NAD(P)-dependent dehydrogenase (short-subunit alcohol dehydrogenase family)
MSQYPDLRGKVALVTGAGREKGLGAAIALRLAAEGCDVVLADRGDRTEGKPATISAEMQAVARSAQGLGVHALCVCCDMTIEDEIQAMVDQAIAHFGRLDILVNNAGIGFIMKPILEMSLAEFDMVLNVNLRGVWIASKYAAAAMIQAGHGGRIINIASQAAKSGFPYASAYCASKHGLVGLTRVCAIEWGKHQINVNAVCPNHVTTDLGAWQNEYFSKALGMSLEQYLSAMKARIPLGRAGLPSDTANACAFLASAQSVYMTGEAMNVSGGEEYH